MKKKSLRATLLCVFLIAMLCISGCAPVAESYWKDTMAVQEWPSVHQEGTVTVDAPEVGAFNVRYEATSIGNNQSEPEKIEMAFFLPENVPTLSAMLPGVQEIRLFIDTTNNKMYIPTALLRAGAQTIGGKADQLPTTDYVALDLNQDLAAYGMLGTSNLSMLDAQKLQKDIVDLFKKYFSDYNPKFLKQTSAHVYTMHLDSKVILDEFDVLAPKLMTQWPMIEKDLKALGKQYGILSSKDLEQGTLPVKQDLLSMKNTLEKDLGKTTMDVRIAFSKDAVDEEVNLALDLATLAKDHMSADKLLKVKVKSRNTKADHKTIQWPQNVTPLTQDELMHMMMPSIDDEITIFVDGNLLASDVSPQITEDRVMLPLRALGESIGAEFSWDGDTQTVTMDKANEGKVTLHLKEGKATLSDGTSIDLSPNAYIFEGRTFVPVRFVAEQLNYNVNYVDATRTVLLTTK